MERDFNLGGREFRLSKLDPFKQFHIARRVAPIMSDLLPAFQKAARKGLTTEESISKLSEDQKMEAVAEIAGPVMDGLSKLTDADSDFVLRGLLASVQMKQATGNWAAVATQEMLMIQDMELPVLLQIAGRAFMFNLGNFIGGPVAGSATVRA
jgi:hypothetical protein